MNLELLSFVVFLEYCRKLNKTKSCETTTIVKKSVNCCLLSNIADVQMVRSRLD
jgi:hypothetical protein